MKVKYLVCECGWRSKAYPIDLKLGGQLSCPNCENIEVYVLNSIIKKESFNPSKRTCKDGK